MKLLNLIGKTLIWITCITATFAIVCGVAKWRIDTFLIGVILLIVAGALRLSEKQVNNENNNN